MKQRLKINLAVIVIVVLLALLLIQVSDTRAKVKGWYNFDKAQDLLKALSWLKAHSHPEDVVLTTWTLGSQVATYADRKVLATSKVYPSEIKSVAERYRDISRFFFAQDQAEALKIVRKYRVKFIFLPKKFEFWICRYIGACRLVSESYQAWGPQQENTIAAQMLRNQISKKFSLYYKSKHYLIYKFMGDV